MEAFVSPASQARVLSPGRNQGVCGEAKKLNSLFQEAGLHEVSARNKVQSATGDSFLHSDAERWATVFEKVTLQTVLLGPPRSLQVMWALVLLPASQPHTVHQEISVFKSRKGTPETHCYWQTSLHHKEHPWPLGLILLSPLGSCFGVSRFVSPVNDPRVQVCPLQAPSIFLTKPSRGTARLLKCCHDNSKSTESQQEGGEKKKPTPGSRFGKERQWKRNSFARCPP